MPRLFHQKDCLMKTLADAFEHTLKDIYYAENAIARALPKVIEAVSQSEFKSALLSHLAETKEQIKILVKVFKTIGVAASGEKCHAIEGLIKETEGILTEAKGPWPRTPHSPGPARRSSTTKLRATEPCASGRRPSKTKRPTSCSPKSWIWKRRRITN